MVVRCSRRDGPLWRRNATGSWRCKRLQSYKGGQYLLGERACQSAFAGLLGSSHFRGQHPDNLLSLLNPWVRSTKMHIFPVLPVLYPCQPVPVKCAFFHETSLNKLIPCGSVHTIELVRFSVMLLPFVWFPKVLHHETNREDDVFLPSFIR